ncbi:MAG: AMP-binding protein [Dissulfurispiraceae bacterium]|jgi:long-chain acyl-CoA synthetase|nr:AMP-binding protein [Dissulfurispiraceae bacterium]
MENSIQTLHELLAQKAAENPERVFMRFEGKKYTLSNIDLWAEYIAGSLVAAGFSRSSKAAILARNCPEFIAAYFGILKAGGIVVPINIMLAPDEIRYILNDSEASVCFYGEENRDVAAMLRDMGSTEFIPLLKANQMHKHTAPAASASQADDVSTILYTSGTTGHPKGAMLTHKNLLSNAVSCTKALDVFPKDRFVVFLPLSHAFTFTVCVLLPLYVGASLTLIASVSPFTKVIKRMILDRVNIFVAVPAVYDILAKRKVPLIVRLLLRLRLSISGASALSVSTLEIFEKKFRVPLLEGYGMTEASPVISVNRLGRSSSKHGTVGLPLLGTEVKVVDDNGAELPEGSAGELTVKGPGVMKGYYRRDADTALTIKDGWLYTGDIAVIDAEGFIKIVDRKKDLIIVDGLNIYPSEVENALQKHPAVAACAMIGLNDRGRELPVMFVMARKDSSVNELELKKFLRGKIASFKMPRKFVLVDELPKTITGKILKRELKKWELPA